AIRPVSMTRRRPANVSSILGIVRPESVTDRAPPAQTRSPTRSVAQPEVFDERPVSLHVLSLQIFEKTAPLAHEHEQPAPAVMVLLVRPEMIGQMIDPGREQRDLDRGTPPVVGVELVLADDLALVDR